MGSTRSAIPLIIKMNTLTNYTPLMLLARTAQPLVKEVCLFIKHTLNAADILLEEQTG